MPNIISGLGHQVFGNDFTSALKHQNELFNYFKQTRENKQPAKVKSRGI